MSYINTVRPSGPRLSPRPFGRYSELSSLAVEGVLELPDRLVDGLAGDHRAVDQVLRELLGELREDALAVAARLAADEGLEGLREALDERRPALRDDLGGRVLPEGAGGEREGSVGEAETLRVDARQEGGGQREFDRLDRAFARRRGGELFKHGVGPFRTGV